MAWHPVSLGRRSWLGLGAAALVGAPGAAWWAYNRDPALPGGPFGGLRRDPAGIFDLLEGFTYRVIDRVGRLMDDGYPVPPRPDGMACFSGDDGALILMRNHEMPPGSVRTSVGRPWPEQAYTEDAGGGVTRAVLDPSTFAVRASNLVLAGTSMNCSGGATPFGWISCEEDPSDPVHGFAFLCDPNATTIQPPERIDGYGRFKHEAAAMHVPSGRCYLTEDRSESCLYRFVPRDASRPFDGVLQAMRIVGHPAEQLTSLSAGEGREIEWIDLPHATPREDTLRLTAQGLGAAIIRRGEGICMQGETVVVCSTTGGPIDSGQLLGLEDGPDGGTLEVISVSTDRAVMDMPDNVIVSPQGLLWFVEDGRGHDLLRFVPRGAAPVALGRNAMSAGEIAGVCFDPAGETCFLNLQEDGLTLAVTGPFGELEARL